jgi:hypothetical protein
MTMWYEIAEFPGYRLSQQAEVLSLLSPEPLIKKAHLDKATGYLRVTLSRDGKEVNYPLHQLMAKVFLPPPGDPSMQVCHNDGVRTNLALSNLRWDYPVNNTADAIKHGTHHSVTEANRTECDSGHEFTPQNTMRRKGKYGDVRKCKECHRISMARYRARRKAGLTATPEPPRIRVKPQTEAEWDAYLGKDREG